MVGIMSEDDEYLNSSRGRRHMRHTPSQTQRLESYFEECQHPNDRQRQILGRELGLTSRQIKFWFQNKRTLVKAQNARAEGNALKEENERLRIEILAAREVLKDEFCEACKGLSQEQKELILHQLQMENTELTNKYKQLCHLLASMGISVAKLNSLVPPSLGLPDGISLDHDNRMRIPNDHSLLSRLKEQRYADLSLMARTVANATDELTSLLVNEAFWMKDPTDGRYVIHHENYEKIFPRINHLRSSHARFESSKVEGIVRMNGTKLVEMLMDPTKRMDLFPTIMTKAMTVQEFTTQIPGSQSGSLQLVYEQIHTLSPLVAPRDFYFLRYCHQSSERSWMIVEVSHDIFDGSQHISPYQSWRFPSGCLVRDMSNGCSNITWLEHVEVDDKALTHELYRDVTFRGMTYGAERWLLTLQRMCERFTYEMMKCQKVGEVITLPEGRKSIMNLSHRMVKNLNTNLTMKHKLDIPQLSKTNIEFRIMVCKSMGFGQSDGLIVNAATSLWLPLSYHVVFDFLKDEKMRAQWDVLSKGIPFQEIASFSYGEHTGNRVSIVQPLVPSENDVLVLQESCIDPLGAIVAYAPIDTKTLDIAISGVDSSNIPVLPSGFIISSDGHPATNTTDPSGSLLTVVFQILSCDGSSPNEVNMEMVANVTALIRATVDNIKSALICIG